MKRFLLIIPLLALGACASAGSFTGAVIKEVTRGPDYVVIERPVYRPVYRHYYYEPQGWMERDE